MSRRPTPRPNQDGEWDPSGAAQKGGLNKSIQDAGWGQLARMIWYKAEEAGIVVMRVNPQYTSQTCPECGHVAKENRVKQAKFKCLACGHTDHADVNAALNILRLGQSQRGAAQAAEREVPSETTSRGCEAALGAGPKRRIMCQDSL
jgi:putative transposase